MNNKLVVLFVTVCLIICCINANNENNFHSRDYLDTLNEGLETFPRFEDSWLNFSSADSDNILVVVVHGFSSINSFLKNILTYPFKVIVWVFKMIGLILPSFIWWQ